MPDNRLAEELAWRAKRGDRPVSLAILTAKLAALGYRLDRRMDCLSNNRYLTGERAGCSYPAINAYLVEKDTGLSFDNVNARRDANFRALQELRKSDSLFAVVRGRILEI